MADPIPMTAAGHSHCRSQTDENEAGLRAEVCFWKELLETCNEDTPYESRERMGYALALAEKKLKSLFENYHQPGDKAGGRPNVFHLDAKRRQAQ